MTKTVLTKRMSGQNEWKEIFFIFLEKNVKSTIQLSSALN